MPRSSSPEHALKRIAEWWADDGDEYTRRHDDKSPLCTAAVETIVLADGDTSPEVRSAWLRLFISGVISTIGRTASKQNRGFLKLLDDSGWLDILLDPEDGGARWLREVQRYLDRDAGRTRYYHWLSRFVGITLIGRHLDQFALAFRSINHLRGDWTLRDVLAVRTSQQFAGSGLDAPSLVPVLGIGACSVVRELRRAGVVTNPAADRYCYPPARRVRALLQRLGWRDDADDATRWDQSRSIHDFLKAHLTDPTFAGAYDIPLLTLADDDDLQDRVLGG